MQVPRFTQTLGSHPGPALPLSDARLCWKRRFRDGRSRKHQHCCGLIKDLKGLNVGLGLIHNEENLSWCYFIGTVNNHILYIHRKCTVHKAFFMGFILISLQPRMQSDDKSGFEKD